MTYKKSGFSLVGAIVALVAIIVGVLAISRMSNSINISEKRLDRRVDAEQVMTLTARVLIDRDFSAIVDLCEKDNSKGVKAMAGAPVRGRCTDTNGKYNLSGSLNSTSGSGELFEIHLNNKGEPDNDGKYCVELSQCEYKAGNHLLDVLITAFYPSADAQQGALSASLKFRRAR